MTCATRLWFATGLSVWLFTGQAAADDWIAQYTDASRTAREACKDGRLQACKDALLRASAATDGRPDIRCRLALVESQLAQIQAALIDLRICVASGIHFPEFATAASLQTLPGYSDIAANQRRLSALASNYEPRYSLTDKDLLAEDIAFDPLDESFLISSVRQRKLIRLARDGRTSDVALTAAGPLWGMFALALDTQRHVLWATTTAVAASLDYSAADDGRSAVLKIDARSGAVLARLELADRDPHGFGDISLGANGDLYVSDGTGGGVYVVRATAQMRLETLVAPGSLRSPQTPALIAEQGTLLVPDYSRGIAAVDLAQRKLEWLDHPPELALMGIDGLYVHGRTLVAIQNGTAPERILVLTLDAACRRVQSWHVAVARAPGLGDPTHGVVVGDALYFLANSGWDRVQETGGIEDGPSAAPAMIWRLPLPVDASLATCRAARK